MRGRRRQRPKEEEGGGGVRWEEGWEGGEETGSTAPPNTAGLNGRGGWYWVPSPHSHHPHAASSQPTRTTHFCPPATPPAHPLATRLPSRKQPATEPAQRFLEQRISIEARPEFSSHRRQNPSEYSRTHAQYLQPRCLHLFSLSSSSSPSSPSPSSSTSSSSFSRTR